MKRLRKALVFCLAMSLAAPLPAQDNSGGAGGGNAGAGADAGGGAGAAGGGTGDNSGGITPAPGAGALGGGQNGAGAPASSQGNNGGGLFSPGSPAGNDATQNNGTGTGSESIAPGGGAGSEGSSTIAPGPSSAAPAGPGFLAPLPNSTAASPPGGSSALNQGVLSAPPPVSLSVAGGYGVAGKTFTLGEGRLAKPPIVFTLSVSQGYDDNIESTPNVPAQKAVTEPGPQLPLEQKILGYRINFPAGPILGAPFRPKSPQIVVSPATPAQKPIGSAVSAASLGMQVQKADPRTVFTMDASLGVLDYWSQAQKLQYTGGLGLNFIHRFTPRLTLTAAVDSVYQNQPDFSRLNTPTNNVTGDYLNANTKFDLTYAWTPRFSTVASYGLAATLQQSQSIDDLYVSTYGIQTRYLFSPRNTFTLELRQSDNSYPSQPAADSADDFFLVGLDSVISSRLRNTFSLGEEISSYTTGGSSGGGVPYFESSTSFTLPRGGLVQWTNRYGLENYGNAQQTITSYRTGLSLGEPLGTKLSAALSLDYNYIDAVDKTVPSGSYTQQQIQSSLSLQYTVTPRLSYSLGYSYIQLLSSTPNSSYRRNQISLGVTYTY